MRGTIVWKTGVEVGVEVLLFVVLYRWCGVTS